MNLRAGSGRDREALALRPPPGRSHPHLRARRRRRGTRWERSRAGSFGNVPALGVTPGEERCPSISRRFSAGNRLPLYMCVCVYISIS